MAETLQAPATPNDRQIWQSALALNIAKGLCGIIAIMVAVKAAAYQPVESPALPYQEHIVRVLAFFALTVWTTFTIGTKRHGAAAMITLAFAVFVEMFLVPVRTESVPGIVAANLGIVLAYCTLRLYMFAKGEPEKA